MKTYKPTTPSRRNTTTVTFKGKLTTGKPFKKLTRGAKKTGGRNNQGRITTPHQGGGHKQKHRLVDFLLEKKDIPARIETIEYDPHRSGFVGIVVYADGERRYMVLPQRLNVGDTIITSENAPAKLGNRLMLKNIPVGTFVYNVEIRPGGGAKLGRSAGVFVQVTAHDEGRTTLKMPSSEVRKVSDHCFASVGEVSNEEHKLMQKGKAGRSRWLGIRPTVRGSAMNPVDHPHGGGEGRQGVSLRRGPKTRQGKLAYGVKTRRPKKYSNDMIVSRRKTKRQK